MKTNNKCAAVRLEKSKLVAALAILAVAFVVIAAVPAVDAADEATTSKTVNVASYDELKAAIEATSESAADKIILTADIDMTEKVTIDIGRNVTLDLAGKTITKTQQKIDSKTDFTSENRMKVFNVEPGFTMTISDSVGNGKIVGKSTAGSTYDDASGDQVISVGGGSSVATLNLNKITVESDFYGIGVWAKGKVVANGTSIKTVNASTLGLNGSAVGGSEGADVEINGGTYSSDNAPAFFWSNTKALKITGATISGAAALDIRNGSAELTNVTIKMNKQADGTVGTSGPASFNVGIGVYASSVSSYGNPSVTLQNVTFEAAKGISVDAEIYYGTLVFPQTIDASKKTATFEEMIGALDKVTSPCHYANLTIKDKNGAEQTKITSTANNASSIILSIDGKKICNDAVLDKVAFVGDASMVKTGQTLTINNAASFKGTLSYDGTSAKINLKGGSTGLTITAGSLGFTGDYTPIDSTTADGRTVITITSGTAFIDANMTIPANTIVKVDEKATLTVSNNVELTIGGELDVDGKLVIKEDSSNADNSGKVTNTGKLNIGEKGNAVVGGTINGSGPISNAGTITITNKDADVTAPVSGSGNVDTSGAQSEGGISGEWKTTTTYTKFQTVTLLGNTTLTAGTVITIEGTLVIPEGTTLVIEDGAQLIVSGGFGKIQNAGTIEVQSNGTSAVAGGLVNNGALIENSGSIVLNYNVDDSTTDFKFTETTKASFILSGKLDNTGDINVGEQSYFNVGTGADFVNKGTVVSRGMISGTIKNESTVTVDGTVSGNLTVNNIADGATVDVVSAIALASGNVIVNNDIKLSKPSDVKEYTEDSTTILALDKQFAVKGLAISSTLVKDTKNSTTTKTIYDRYNILAGTLTINQVNDYANGATAPEKIVEITADGNTLVKESLDLPAGIVLKISGSTTAGVFDASGTIVAVSGEISYTKITDDATGATETGKTAAKIGGVTIDGAATLKVSGSITSANALTPTTKINATYYKVDATTNPVVAEKHVYTTFAPAVASGAKKITVYGENKVSEDVSVPAGITITVEGKLTVDKDATVIVADGAKMINGASGSVKVEGTLTFDAFKTGDKLGNTVVSQVVIQGEKDRTYTNLANAIAKAQSGSTITLSGNANITSDLTIPEGIKIDTKEFKVTVGKNATLTVDGELFLNGASSTLTLEDPTSEFDKDGAVVVNGVISSTEGFNSKVFLGTDGYVIPGAYYSMTEKTNTTYYVTPVAAAAKLISNVDDQKVTIDGKEVATGDVTFTGVDGTATVIVNTELTAASITLDNAKLVLNAGKKISATVTNGVGTVVLKGTVGTSDMNIVSSGADDSKKITIDGVFVVSTATGSTDKMTVDGTVNFANFNVDKMTVDGTAVDAEGKTLNVATLIVNGTVTVSKDATLTSTVLAEVKGTIAVAQKSADEPKEGKFIAKDLYIGTTKNATENTAAAASVTGKVSVDNILVAAAGVTVPEAFTAEDSTYINTEFYVGNGLYITVYAKNPNTTPVTNFGASKDNAKFEGWSTVDGDATKKVADSVYIGAKDKVYALFNEKIYMVTVVFGAGIENVAIDGNLVSADNTGAYVVKDLKAGTHTVTYSLSNNYSGTATLTVNGEKQSGMTFTASGTDYNYDVGDKQYVNYTLQLSGVTASGYTPAPTPAPSTGDDDGLSITDYLLIVLVVLIVIMAVIVAMRLMRS